MLLPMVQLPGRFGGGEGREMGHDALDLAGRQVLHAERDANLERGALPELALDRDGASVEAHQLKD
jgi:hypothetical protein